MGTKFSNWQGGTNLPSYPTNQGANDSGAGSWMSSNSGSMPEEGWVDAIYYSLRGSGGTRTVQWGFYTSGSKSLLAGTQAGSVGTAQAWNPLAFALNSGNNNGGGTSPWLYVPAGTGFLIAAHANGAANLDMDASSGDYYHISGGSGLPSPTFSGFSTDPFGSFHGRGGWVLSYFPRMQISAVDPGPVAPGQTFHITGRSFTAGINSILLNGTACPTYTVNSDTQITVTVPSGATSGHVYVDSAAGTATSTGTVTVSSARVRRSGVWTFASAADVQRSAAFVTGSEVAVFRGVQGSGGSWHQGQ